VFAGALEGGEGGLLAVGVLNGLVDVRPVGDGHAPVSHGALGVERGGVLERADRFIVIEGAQEGQPLVEERLGLLVFGDGAGVLAEAVEALRLRRQLGPGEQHGGEGGEQGGDTHDLWSSLAREGRWGRGARRGPNNLRCGCSTSGQAGARNERSPPRNRSANCGTIGQNCRGRAGEAREMTAPGCIKMAVGE
jgi:hypothetical protein